jgi:hypothetical protein
MIEVILPTCVSLEDQFFHEVGAIAVPVDLQLGDPSSKSRFQRRGSSSACRHPRSDSTRASSANAIKADKSALA